ncbi:MAG: hypothetical protein GX299_08515 [Epulopiscium sp.]|nr:hypothetical protein [Candidatus Epulonipiscium sp.]
MKRTVVIENRGGHDGIATGGHYGSWARVWTSRQGVATYHVAEENHHIGKPGRMTPHKDYVAVEVSTTNMFNHEKDYILVEHKRSANPNLRGSSSRERYELLAGIMPAWASFPSAWQEWVQERAVQEAAADHIIAKVPETREAVRYARQKSSKGNIRRAWDDVRWLCSDAMGKEIDYPDGSWTAVRAIPIRIAQKLGGFRSPIPRPVWQKRDASCSFLLVSP